MPAGVGRCGAGRPPANPVEEPVAPSVVPSGISCFSHRRASAPFVALATALALAAALFPASAARAERPPARPDTRQVMFVGNNWDGTADVIDTLTFQRLRRINTIPDKAEREAEIMRDPEKLAYFLAIREAIGEGHDQYTDDMFTSHDGRLVCVSRPSFADVVGIDIASGAIVWRFEMEGRRSDHMAISPDGTTPRCRTRPPKGPPPRCRHRRQDRRVPLGRHPTREELLQGRHQDLSRQHRAGLHPHRRGDHRDRA